MAVRHPRLRTALAGVLVVPLVATPVVAAPAVALADYGGRGGYGIYGGYDGWPLGGYAATPTTATIDAAPATAAESRGVVLVRTEIDYGTAEAAGTGLVLAADGIVVTNHHVVQGATSVTVTVPGGDTYTADVVGYDATHDIAVLRLRGASALATVATDTGAVTAGEQVTAVGNAEGTGTLAAADGTVTTPRTAITVQEDDGGSARLAGLIEVDADVVSGDSGGALLDADGEVIGMNVAASSGSAQISGYAIPIRRVLRIADRILAGDETGDVVVGYEAALGVELYGSGTPVVAGVPDGGAAAAAGITPGSTISTVDGTNVSRLSDITRVLAAHKPGDVVVVTWTDRAGVEHRARVTLGRAPLA